MYISNLTPKLIPKLLRKVFLAKIYKEFIKPKIKELYLYKIKSSRGHQYAEI